MVFDLIDVPAAIVRRLPFTTWLRVQRLIEGTETVCLLLGDESIARSAGGLSVSLPRERPPADGAGPRAPALRLFPRPAIEPHVVAARSALLRDDGQP